MQTQRRPRADDRAAGARLGRARCARAGRMRGCRASCSCRRPALPRLRRRRGAAGARPAHAAAERRLGGCCRRCCRQPGERCWRSAPAAGFVTACLCARRPRCARWSSTRIWPSRARQPRRPRGAQREVVDADALRIAGGTRYDAIAVTASLPVYDARFERTLDVGGRLFVVVGEAPVMDARLVTPHGRRTPGAPEPVRDRDRPAGERRSGRRIYVLSAAVSNAPI